MDLHLARESLQSAAATFAVGRLIYLRLTNRFPALFGFLVFFALFEALFSVVPTGKLLYFRMYVVFLPLQTLLSIIAVRELFALVFEDYPGIQTIGRWAMYSGVVLSLVASLLIARIFWRGGAGNRASRLFYVEVVQRSVFFSLAVVIVTILFALSRYPLRLGRNAYFSILFFSFFFLTEAAQLLIDSLAPALYNRYVDGAESIMAAILLSGWAVLLGREPSPIISRLHFSPLSEARLMEQLDSLNAFLSRAGRR